jgi:hypothetical protein
MNENGRAATMTNGFTIGTPKKYVVVADVLMGDAKAMVDLIEAKQAGATEPPEDLLAAVATNARTKSVLLFFPGDDQWRREVMRRVAERLGARTNVPIEERVTAYCQVLQQDTDEPVSVINDVQEAIMMRALEWVADREMAEASRRNYLGLAHHIECGITLCRRTR